MFEIVWILNLEIIWHYLYDVWWILLKEELCDSSRLIAREIKVNKNESAVFDGFNEENEDCVNFWCSKLDNKR